MVPDLDAAIVQLDLRDGAVLSFHHHLRNGDAVLCAVIDAADAGSGTIGTRSTAGDPQTRVVDKGAETTDIIAAPESVGQDASADTPQ